MTSFFAWNMRGFNLPRKHGVVRSWVQETKPQFGCLVETRVLQENLKNVMDSALPGWQFLHNYDFHRLGRIWFCWSGEVNVTLLNKTAQIITCAVQVISTNEVFICSAVYASNVESERRELWDQIRETKKVYGQLGHPWILMGDYNETLATDEHSRGHTNQTSHGGMRQFQNLVADCNLVDLAHVGAIYTWWNKRQFDPIGKKLDRALINGAWLIAFPQSYATFEAGGVSDHARCLVQLSQPVSSRRKPFKFFNYLVDHDQFLPTVARVWEELPPLYHSRAALYKFHKQLKLLKHDLRALNQTHYGDLPNRTKEAYEELCIYENKVLLNPTEEAMLAASRASDRWHHLAYVEERFFQQKSCVKWLMVGDHNTSAFHRAAAGRVARNSIKTLETEAGVVLSTLTDVKREAVSHFQRFLQSQPPNITDISMDRLRDLLPYRCSDSTAAALVEPITAMEVLSALQSLPNGKVSGPDGFTKEFYIAAWPVIGNDFVTAVQSFFLFGFMPISVNATILTLIPKTEDALKMKDYRPIACCNLLYKVISKILAKRLKRILPEAIESNQSAFVKGRLLLENVLLASELVSGYHNSTLTSRSTIKFDIAKAFDTVRWSFVRAVLRAMGLPDIFINWIYVCISTASFSVAVNGDLEGFFTSARGIRQGCSLSPYLYVILSNVLSRMLNRAAANGEFGYHPLCQGVGLTHLSFADDILVFTDGTSTSLKGLMSVLEEYARISGLSINVAKSSIFLAGAGDKEMQNIIADIGIGVGTLPIRYLGLPLTTKAMGSMDYEPLVNKIRKRFLSWAHSPLSYAGRLQLIRSVINGILNFWSSAYILPKKCLQTIESMCCAFLWSGSPSDCHKSKVSWEELCYPKSEGGLGLRRLRDSSRVFALNLIYRIFTLIGSPWVDWIHRHLLCGKSFWDVKSGSKGSWVWRKLLKLRPRAYPFLRYVIGDGKSARFWFDDWMQVGSLMDLTGEGGTRIFGVLRQATVADVASASSWKIRGLRSRHYPTLTTQILAQPIPSSDAGPDIMLWRHDDGIYQRVFKASSTWQQLRARKVVVPWHRLVWFSQGVPRQSFITWLSVRNRLSTGDRMRGWGTTQCCIFCGELDETRDHLFYACPYTFTVWLALAGKILGSAATPDWDDTMTHLAQANHGLLDNILLKMIFQSSIYHIWRERNARIHGTRNNMPHQLVRTIDKAIRNRLTSLKYIYPHKLEGLMRRWFAVK